MYLNFYHNSVVCFVGFRPWLRDGCELPFYPGFIAYNYISKLHHQVHWRRKIKHNFSGPTGPVGPLVPKKGKYKNTEIEKFKVEILRKYSVLNAAFENKICKQTILFLLAQELRRLIIVLRIIIMTIVFGFSNAVFQTLYFLSTFHFSIFVLLYLTTSLFLYFSILLFLYFCIFQLFDFFFVFSLLSSLLYEKVIFVH